MLKQFFAVLLFAMIHLAAVGAPTEAKFCKPPWTEPPAGRGAPRTAALQATATPGTCINGYWVATNQRYCPADENSTDSRSKGGVYDPKQKACIDGFLLDKNQFICYDKNGKNGKLESAIAGKSCPSGIVKKPVFQ